DGLADAVAMLGPPLQSPEHKHVKGAMEELQALFVGVSGHSRRQSTALDVGRLRLVPIVETKHDAYASALCTRNGGSAAHLGIVPGAVAEGAARGGRRHRL